MTVAGQDEVDYSYDDANRLTQITQGSASVNLSYDPNDRRTSLTLPNGITIGYGYDTDSRLTSLNYALSGTTLGDLQYGYDANGQRTQIGGSWARTNLPVAMSGANYNADNQLTSWNGATLTYDANGNLTSDGTTTYSWDARDQLSSLTGPTNASFSYDGFGRRASTTIAGTTTNYLYDGANLVQELTGGTPTANMLTGLGIDEVFSRTDSTGTRSFITDALGSTLTLTDESGTEQTTYTYDPFGNPTASGASDANTQQYTGRENDGTGLQYNRGRYYSPTLQRFISEDPLGFGGGDPNLYAYVGNDPLNATDPSGMLSFNRVANAIYRELIQQSMSTSGRKSMGTAPLSQSDRMVLLLDLSALGISAVSALYTDATTVAFCGFGPEGCAIGYAIGYAEVQPFLFASDALGTAATVVGCLQGGFKTLKSASCNDSVEVTAAGWMINEPNIDALMDYLTVERDLGVLK